MHQTSGLRVVFENSEDRARFSELYEDALRAFRQRQRSELTAVFDGPIPAEEAYRELMEVGVRQDAISLLWRAGQFLESNHGHPPGHSRLSVATASTAAGLAGAIFGIVLLAVPGLGLVAASGAIAANALGTMGAVGGALGASGGGIARMLTDLDVDDREIPYFAMRIAHGKIFLSVDPVECECSLELVRATLVRHGGQFAIAASG
ncbi:hypothetical protein N0B51_10335 [Tsuneonella sp. YG55]|uniref:DUF1269 domain-containing protein n=1 Tax=Tsuneonella litorea TaxID=2976475 RepID=A0A9X2W3M6_9SPHN|nr:hypothetical protein [Tsuneonella litorea]MCT2559375.1 hypothetical protein [Tsuneonella litorea]